MVAIFQKTEGNERAEVGIAWSFKRARSSRVQIGREEGEGPWKEERKEASINSIIRK